MIFFPPIDADYATARLVMPEGTAYEVTEQKLQKMINEAHKLQADYTGKYLSPDTGKTEDRSLVGHIITTVGGQNIAGVRGSASSGVANLGEVQLQLMPPEDRIHFDNKKFHDIDPTCYWVYSTH